MAFYLSPLVATREIDLSTTIPAVATSIGVIILRNTYKGPERKKTLITTTNDLIETFGKPTTDSYIDMLPAVGFLRYGSALYCTRTMSPSATFSGTQAVSGATATFTPYTTSTAYKMENFASEDPDDFDDETVSGSYPFALIANSRGVWGDSIRVAVIDQATYNAIAAGTYSNWDTLYPNDSTYSAVRGIDSYLYSDRDFLIVVQNLPQGKENVVANWETVEVWNVSTDENAIDDEGQRMYAPLKINTSSQYIRICMNTLAKNQSITISTAQFQQFAGGQDGDDLLAISDAQIIEDLDLYGNAEEIDVNIFIDANKSDIVKSYLLDSIVGVRKDCIAILDCPSTAVINQTGSEAENLRVYKKTTLNESSSYGALYGNWLEVYDKWNGKYRWIPASGHVAGIYANTDSVSDPWFAPAGLNRAVLGNVRRLAWNPTLGQRDILYKNGINPIVSFSGQGKVVWGQKTMLDKESAFNRVNVRRLFIVLEKAISTAAKYFLFEPNDDLTRLLLVNMIDPYLRDVRSRRGIYEYLIVCDETNNTPERIDRNELWADIYIKPVRSAEYIVLSFIATKTGASFTELIGAGA